MAQVMSQQLLQRENNSSRETGGSSPKSRDYECHPAFLDMETQVVYPSRFANGEPAPFHNLEGLPDDVVLSRGRSGRVATVKTSIVSGFVLKGRFYNRDDAVRKVAELDSAMAAHSSVLIAHGAEQKGAADPAPGRLQQVLSELAEVNRALTMSQQQLTAAWQEIDTLVERNSRLTQELTRLGQKEAQASHLAYHDELTGLPNRRLLLDRLNQVMAQGARQHKQVALLVLDLNGFKSVNDRLGHAAGDNLLQQVAKRLVACIRVADTVCRYGGDEFVIMLPEIDGQEMAAAVVQKIHAQLAVPFVVDGSVITVTASIGTAVYRADGHQCSDLIKQADIAMYRAKARCGAPTSLLQPAIQS
jgi:diguanylate cyclase (GGDEF)-like protein